jgi:hypothetical protein
MSVTFMGSRQRRHGERRNQNDRGGHACKLSLQPHAVCLSQVPSAAKQFSLIASAAQPGNFETCSPHEKSVHKSGIARVIPRREVASPGTCHPGPLLLIRCQGDRSARVSLSHNPPSGDIRDSDYREGAGPSGRAEAVLVVPALRRCSYG